jgi:hypothetical protein
LFPYWEYISSYHSRSQPLNAFGSGMRLLVNARDEILRYRMCLNVRENCCPRVLDIVS